MLNLKPLERQFYQRHPAEVGPDLLGKILIRQTGNTAAGGTVTAGRIVETEAYCSTDPASHTFRGKTERNRAMFGDAGHAYIYFIHGMHYCINVTARWDTPAGGVLIRALEPLEGIEAMQQRRKRTAMRDLASGPAKLTQALEIDQSLYGVDMTRRGALYIAEASEPQTLAHEATPRIGISRAVEVPWRFVIAGSPYLSR